MTFKHLRALALAFTTVPFLVLVMGRQFEGCSVCGEGKEVGDPFGVFVFPGQPSILCGIIEDVGEGGVIPLDQCSFLPALLASVCECKPIGSVFVRPTPFACYVCGVGREVGSPENIVSEPLFSIQGGNPTTCGDLEAAGENGDIPSEECNITNTFAVDDACNCKLVDGVQSPASCSICGEGKRVGIPHGLFNFPGQPAITCGDIERAGDFGFIPLDQCPFLAQYVEFSCECFFDGPTLSPSKEAPTWSPVTIVPSLAPSFSSCSVCGEGFEVGKPEAILTEEFFMKFWERPILSCEELEAAGKDPRLFPEFCHLVAPYIIARQCDCRPIDATQDIVPCTVCQEGGVMENPERLVLVSSLIDIRTTCSMLDDAATAGNLNEAQCQFASYMSGRCGCSPVGPTGAPSPEPSPECSICGTGREVGSPSNLIEPGVFLFSDQPSISCGDLQAAGDQGLISEEHCIFLPVLIQEQCACRLQADGIAGLQGTCPVCGIDRVVGAPDNVYELTGQPPILCSALEAAGVDGIFNGCFLIPLLVGRHCACHALVEEDRTPCSFCGVGLEVGAPDNSVYPFEGSELHERITCQDYEYAATSGLFPDCQGVATLTSERCDCRPATTGSSSVSPSLPTPAVSVAPSDVSAGGTPTTTISGGPASLPPVLPSTEPVDSSVDTHIKSPKGTKKNKGMMAMTTKKDHSEQG